MPNDHYFKLEGHTPVAVSIEEYAMWEAQIRHREKVVRQSMVGKIQVSTVFLGINHQWQAPPARPLVFETMTFGSNPEQHLRRYSTWEEAEIGHAEVLALVMQAALESEVSSPPEALANTRTRFERLT